VALHVDQRLQAVAELERDQLNMRVVLETNREARTAGQRAQDVMESLTYLLDLHGWTASWDARGLRLSHHRHSLVLGVPENVARYVAELSDA